MGHLQFALDAAYSCVGTSALPDLAEAAARVGEPAVAERAADQLSRSTLASGTPFALGVEARTRALLTGGSDADGLSSPPSPTSGRPAPWCIWPAPTCSTASGGAASAGGEKPARSCGWPTRCSAPRAGLPSRNGAELEATGEHTRRRTVEAADSLSPQGGPHRPSGSRGRVEPRNRRPALRQPAYRRVSPDEDLHQARCEFPRAAGVPDAAPYSLSDGACPVVGQSTHVEFTDANGGA